MSTTETETTTSRRIVIRRWYRDALADSGAASVEPFQVVGPPEEIAGGAWYPIAHGLPGSARRAGGTLMASSERIGSEIPRAEAVAEVAERWAR